MIKVSTQVTTNETGYWVEVVRERAVSSADGAYSLQFGDSGGDVIGKLTLTAFERGEIVKALGGIWSAKS